MKTRLALLCLLSLLIGSSVTTKNKEIIIIWKNSLHAKSGPYSSILDLKNSNIAIYHFYPVITIFTPKLVFQLARWSTVSPTSTSSLTPTFSWRCWSSSSCLRRWWPEAAKPPCSRRLTRRPCHPSPPPRQPLSYPQTWSCWINIVDNGHQNHHIK